MWTAYFDESGSAEIFAVAGLLAPALQWQRLEREWRKVLEEEGLAFFHAVDCAHRVKQFKGWDTARRDRLVRRLVAIIRRRVQYRVWSAAFLVDVLRKVKGPSVAELPFSLCAQGCASLLRMVALERGAPIAYCFEAGGKGSRRCFQFFRRLEAQGRRDHYQMHSLSTGDKAGACALQAADLHAYETRKWFDDQASGRKTINDPPRRSFNELLVIPEAAGGGYVWTGTMVVKMVGLKDPTGEFEFPMAPDRLDREHKVGVAKRE